MLSEKTSDSNKSDQEIRAGAPWRELTEVHVGHIRAGVVLRVLHAVNQLDIEDLVRWANEFASDYYQPVNFDNDDASALVAARMMTTLDEVVAVSGMTLAKVGNLVYAAAAAERPRQLGSESKTSTNCRYSVMSPRCRLCR